MEETDMRLIDAEKLFYRLLRNQMVIMSSLRNLTTNENIQGLLDDNIKPTAEMLQEMK